MSKPGQNVRAGFKDVLAYAVEISDTYGVRIRLSCVPLSRKSGIATHAILVTAYSTSGRRIPEVEAEQALWPSKNRATREGAEIYLLTRLASALDEWFYRKQRETEQWEAGRLTPLEQYLAGSYPSGAEAPLTD